MKKTIIEDDPVFVEGTLGKFWSFCFRETIDNSYNSNNTIYKNTNYVYQKSDTEFRIKVSPYIDKNINRKIFLKDAIPFYFIEGKIEEKDNGIKISFNYLKSNFLACLTSIIAILCMIPFIGLAIWIFSFALTDMSFLILLLPILLSAFAITIIITALREMRSNIKNDFWEDQLIETKKWFTEELEKVRYTKDEYKEYKEAFHFNDKNYARFTLGIIPIFIIIVSISCLIRVIISEINTDVIAVSIVDAAYSAVGLIFFYLAMLIIAEVRRHRKYKMKLGKSSKNKKRIFTFIFIAGTVIGLLNVMFSRTVVTTSEIYKYNMLNILESSNSFEDAEKIVTWLDYDEDDDMYSFYYKVFFSDGSSYKIDLDGFDELSDLYDLDNSLSGVTKEYNTDEDEFEEVEELYQNDYSDSDWEMIREIFIN